MQEGDLNIFQGANNKQNELEAWIQVKANEAIKELKGLVTEVYWVLLHFLPAAWSHWCFDLKVYPLLHKEILWFWVPLDRMEVLNNKGILLHWCNVLDINLALVNFFGILLILMGVQAVMRTPDGVGGERNPFWSDRAMAGGDQHAASGPHGDGAQRALSSGRVKTADGLTHKDLLDLEALRVQGFKEVEAQIQREMEKRKGENSGSGSFQSVLGEVGVVQGSKTPVDPALGHLVTPPGLPGLPGPAVPASVTPAPVVSVGENLNENLRNLELPKLSPDSTSVDFGDWLAIVGPLMSDLSGTSSQWWALVLDAAAKTYAAWVTSTPLQRLRL